MGVVGYLAVFGRALKQQENHLGIFFALPKVIFSSGVVKIDDEKYLAKDVASFIKEMERRGFVYTDQMGSGYFFQKKGDTYISTSQMYSSHFMVFTYPTVNNQSENDYKLDRIYKEIFDCEVKSIMQVHNKTVTAILKNSEKIEAIENGIDDVFDMAIKSEEKCGRIEMITE